jgi:hypothetical protein
MNKQIKEKKEAAGTPKHSGQGKSFKMGGDK